MTVFSEVPSECPQCGSKDRAIKDGPKWPFVCECEHEWHNGESQPSHPAPLNGQSWPQDIHNVTLDPQILAEARKYWETTSRSENKLPEWLAYFAERIAQHAIAPYKAAYELNQAELQNDVRVIAAKDAEIADHKACNATQQIKIAELEADLAEARKQLETMTRHKDAAQDSMTRIQKHRDSWREYAYGNREKPDDFLDGNKVDRGETKIEQLQAKLLTLREKVNKQAITVIDGKSYCRLCHRCVTDRGHAPGCIVAEMEKVKEQK